MHRRLESGVRAVRYANLMLCARVWYTRAFASSVRWFEFDWPFVSSERVKRGYPMLVQASLIKPAAGLACLIWMMSLSACSDSVGAANDSIEAARKIANFSCKTSWAEPCLSKYDRDRAYRPPNFAAPQRDQPYRDPWLQHQGRLHGELLHRIQQP